MYSSSSVDHDTYEEFLFKRSFPFDQNPSPRQDYESSSFFHFSSPFLDENELLLDQLISSQNQSISMDTCNTITAHVETINPETKIKQTAEISNMEYPSNLKEKSSDSREGNLVPVLRKRSAGKKDRHSKICTAQGVRDRRMRLSLEVARKFFDLQDKLGYDKASKTIEWLFSKSNKAIKELSKNHPEANVTCTDHDLEYEFLMSECDMVIDENYSISGKEGAAENRASLMTKKEDNYKLRKVPCKPNTRESRDKARARARDRTREKMMIKGLKNLNHDQWFASNPNDFQQSGPYNGAFEESISQGQKQDIYTNSLKNQLPGVGIIEEILGSSSSSSWPISGNYSNNSFMGSLGNWDVNNGRITNLLEINSFEGNPNSVHLATSSFPFR